MTKEAKILIGIAVVVLIGGVLLAIYANPKPQEAGQPVDGQSLVRDNSHMTGKKEAKVTLVEFGDFQCPGCAAASPTVKKIIEDYKSNENFNFVFRNFPLEQIHQNARIAAEAAEAAGAQGKYWEMNELLYQKQNEWNVSSVPLDQFSNYAVTLGLDVEKFKQSVLQRLFTDVIDADLKDGNNVKVTGTPTFFLNGVLFAPDPGKIPTLEMFKQAIDTELAK